MKDLKEIVQDNEKAASRARAGFPVVHGSQAADKGFGSMPCPVCGHRQARIVEKRMEINLVRRRRQCLKCSVRFTTHERVAPTFRV